MRGAGGRGRGARRRIPRQVFAAGMVGMSEMRRHLILLLLALAAIVVFWRTRRPTIAVRSSPDARGAAPSPARATPSESRAARDALRERIVRRLEERSARDAGAAPTPAPPTAAAPAARPPGNLRDRIGGRDALL